MARLPFEDPDPSFIPLAGRRALDRAGLKLSLRAWQGLSLLVRETLAQLGELEEVDADRVRSLLEAAHPAAEPIEAAPEASFDQVPEVVRDALGPDRPVDLDAWRRLSPVARYALYSYARRGREAKLTEAYDSLLTRSLGEPSSSG